LTGSAEDLEARALEECAREPIRIPGTVQPHGVYLALTEPELTVAVASANAGSVLGSAGTAILGAGLSDVLGEDAARAVGSAAASDPDEVNPLAVEVPTTRGGTTRFDAILHRSGGLLVVDLEPVVAAGVDGLREATFQSLRGPVRRMRAADSAQALADAVAREIRALTGFDRVMVYRFDPDWNGEVIAEDRRADMEPYLGLRYPASDIPPQARELYRTSWIRLIADVDGVPVPLIPDHNPLDGRPLDLGSSTLRSVSPFHLEYLRNMGVGSSMSISLLDQDRLWGLVACHHDVAHRPSYAVRAAAELLGQLASLLLTTREGAGQQEDAMGVSAALARLLQQVSLSPERLAEALTEEGGPLLELTGARGVAICFGPALCTVGDTPPRARLSAIVEALWDGTDDLVATTDALALRHPGFVDVKDQAGGVLGVRLGEAADRWILWFRPEVVHTVDWGGNPNAGKVSVEPGGTPQLHPRDSFSRWTDTVRLRSLPWLPHQVAAAEALGRHVTDVSRRRAHQEATTAATLQRTLLLEHLPTVPGISLRTRYLPAAQEAVGGDWYDLFLLGEDRIGITLGDVAGHGVEVAGIMAQLRHGLRAYLLREPSPASALTGLNELTHRLLPRELATVVVADLEPATGRLRVATAGHPPPLVIPADGGEPTYLHECRGPALGLLAASTHAEQTWTLGPGDVLVLYSDGLIERRGEPLDTGLERLAARARNPEADLDAFADRLVDAGSDDDVTLLVLRADGASRRRP
jgi:two-component system, chemotaxis family, sensor kinase Cph1